MISLPFYCWYTWGRVFWQRVSKQLPFSRNRSIGYINKQDAHTLWICLYNYTHTLWICLYLQSYPHTMDMLVQPTTMIVRPSSVIPTLWICLCIHTHTLWICLYIHTYTLWICLYNHTHTLQISLLFFWLENVGLFLFH